MFFSISHLCFKILKSNNKTKVKDMTKTVNAYQIRKYYNKIRNNNDNTDHNNFILQLYYDYIILLYSDFQYMAINCPRVTAVKVVVK